MSSAMSRMLVSSNEVVAEKQNLSCHWLISRWLSPQWMVVVTLDLIKGEYDGIGGSFQELRTDAWFRQEMKRARRTVALIRR